MTPTQLSSTLRALVERDITLSVMLWGAPGVGKSATVRAVGAALKLPCIDLRLSQLAPTDLRGLPVPQDGVARWLPPEFLPREGRGILFLDEINMAPPAVQGIAQQLVLDRRVGSYEVPPGWFVWAAGNRREDGAAVFDMPTALTNRFLHLHVELDVDGFLKYAMAHDFAPEVIAFIAFRPALLHKMSRDVPAWPSPRSWEMASVLHKAGLGIGPAVGTAVADEFAAYVKIYATIPDLDDVFGGRGAKVAFPNESSLRYALALGLAQRAESATAAFLAFEWLVEKAPVEWTHMFCGHALERLTKRGDAKAFVTAAMRRPELVRFLGEFRALVG